MISPDGSEPGEGESPVMPIPSFSRETPKSDRPNARATQYVVRAPRGVSSKRRHQLVELFGKFVNRDASGQSVSFDRNPIAVIGKFTRWLFRPKLWHGHP